MEVLATYLKENGLTKSQFARSVGITPQFVSQIISGVRSPGIEVTKKIEAITGIPRHTLRPDVYEAAQ